MNLKSYLYQATGIEAVAMSVHPSELKMLPMYLREVPIRKLCINDKCFYVIYFATPDGITPDRLEKMEKVLKGYLNSQILFCFDGLKSYQRSRLMKRRISFIVPGQQMYIPFLFIDIKEREAGKAASLKVISPIGQLLILYHILVQPVEGIRLKDLAIMLSCSAMSITRAVRELESIGVCENVKGKTKTIKFHAPHAQLWEQSLPYLRSPVKRKVYFESDESFQNYIKSGEPALTYYTNLQSTGTATYAISVKKLSALGLQGSGNSDYGPYCLEIWNYPPEVLTPGLYVDPLSLFLELRDSDDERVQIVLPELLRSVKW